MEIDLLSGTEPNQKGPDLLNMPNQREKSELIDFESNEAKVKKLINEVSAELNLLSGILKSAAKNQ